MRRVVKWLLMGFYWLLGASAFLGITVVLPWAGREAIRAAGWEWWYITLVVLGILVLLVGLGWLHSWAFGDKQ